LIVAHLLNVLPAFLLASLVLAVLPGPATALFLQRTLRDGRPAGLAAVAGNEIGVFCWALAGGSGLSVLLTANRVLFDALHVLGAVVLVALGAQAWRSARSHADEGFGEALTARLPRGRTPGAAFRASLISIAANPKAAVFAITFLPQFLPRHGPVLPTIVVLASIQVIIDTAWCAGLVLLAERARGWLSRGAIRQRMERALGAILVALGFELAAQTR
jgi:threonine/homoserine/homoserine lactone efflux protein